MKGAVDSEMTGMREKEGGQNAVDMRGAEVEQLKVGERLEDRN